MSPSPSPALVTTRPAGQRIALHKRGAIGGCCISGSQIDRALDLKGNSIFEYFDNRAGFARLVRLAPDPRQHRPDRVHRH